MNWRHFINFSFIFELFCFAFSLYLAIGVALNSLSKVPLGQNIAPTDSWGAVGFIISFLIATLILFLLLKYAKKPWLVMFLFYLAVLEGLWLFSQAYLDWPYFLIFFAIVLMYWLIYQNVLIHDLVIILSLSAIAVIFGINIAPSAGILILLFLAVYDFWAVYKTTHMVQMFRGLAESKVYFTLVIPQNWHGLFRKIKTVSPETEFMFLGTGDLAIPAIFVVSCMQISLLTSLITALGAILGFVFLYIIFVTQKSKEPMPGLPPIVLGTLVGFLIAQVIIRL